MLGGINDKIRRTIEVNLKGLRTLGISDPLRGIAKKAKNVQFIAADDMLTNKDIDLHFDSIK